MNDFSTPTAAHKTATLQPARLWRRLRTWLLAPGLDRLAAVMGLWLAIIVIYWPSARALSGVWLGSAGRAYEHGYLLLLASLWLIARERGRLAQYPIRPAPGALALVVMLSALWVWSWRAVIQDPQLLLLPLLWLAAIAAVLGWRTARALAVPIGLVYFAMPALGDVNGLLEHLSATVNGALIWLTGLPAYMHGDFIQLPAGVLQIGAACSGLDQFLAGLALAALYGEICRHSWRRRLTWLIVMGVLSQICNWVRIFIVTVVAYESEMRAPLVRRHIWLGWVLFSIVVAGFLWMAESWDRAHPENVPPPQIPESSSDNRLRPMIAAVALIFLALLPMLAYGAILLRSGPGMRVEVEWPKAPSGWNGPQRVLTSDWQPHFVNSSADSLRAYVNSDGRAVEIFVVAYRAQAQDAKLLGFRNKLLGSRMHAQSGRVVDSSTGHWRETVAADAAGSRSLVWSRYLIGKRRFVRARESQLWYGVAALISTPMSSMVALRAPCRRECVAARAMLATAAERMLPTLHLTKGIPGDVTP
jgi:EpsI family protein